MESELRILMLEDQNEDAWLIERALQKDQISFISARVDTREEFTEALESFLPDVILSDHSLPQFNSIEALTICQKKNLSIPFILVTGAVSEEFAVTCMKKGADDYVLKSNLSRLPLSIRYALRQRRYENSKKEQEKVLRQQNEELKKLNKELDLFVYSTSHNLRAPLRSVLGLVNLSKYEYANNNFELLPSYFRMMEDSIGQLDNTLRRILEYSRNNRMEEKGDIINFKKILTRIFDSLKYINGAQAIQQIVDVHPGPLFISDSMRLGIVLLNLISNAIKYYDQTKTNPFVKVEVYQESTQATILIEDNGIGIAEEVHKLVFDMFYRATEKSDGSGLGLYIVKETVAQMNGTVEFESASGVGTKFKLTIPAIEVA